MFIFILHILPDKTSKANVTYALHEQRHKMDPLDNIRSAPYHYILLICKSIKTIINTFLLYSVQKIKSY